MSLFRWLSSSQGCGRGPLLGEEQRAALPAGRLGLRHRHSSRTSELVEEALAQLESSQAQILEAHVDTIRRLVLMAEFRNHETANHNHRLSRATAALASAVGLPPAEVDLLSRAALLHDVGKVAIPDSILLKPGPLTPAERSIMDTHAAIGAQILAGSPSPILQAGEVIALTHHEKWDGSGYPQGLAGLEIPLWGRICAIGDVFDALTSDRPYRNALAPSDALTVMREGRGAHFDPALFDAFDTRFKQVHEAMLRDMP